jgi:hypothetical protein
MPKTCKSHPRSLKAKVAVEAIRRTRRRPKSRRCSESTRPRSEAGRNRR